MFNIGMTELIIIGAIALLVLGPERLPMVARKAGTLLRDLKRMTNGFKAQINDEMKNHMGPEADDLSKLARDVRAGVRNPADIADALDQAANILDKKQAPSTELKTAETSETTEEPAVATKPLPTRAPGHKAPILDPPEDSNPH